MQFKGTVEIAAPRDTRVGLPHGSRTRSDRAGPAWSRSRSSTTDHFKAKAKVGIGFISAKFDVDMTVAEKNAPDLAVLKAHGQAPGSAVDATANMALSGPAEGPTTMDWSADVLIAGTLASVGARLIEGTANKMIGQTFDCITLEARRASSRPADGVSPRGAQTPSPRRPPHGPLARTCANARAPRAWLVP